MTFTPLQQWLFQALAVLVLSCTCKQALALDCRAKPVPYSANYAVTRNGDQDGSMQVVLERNGEDNFSYRMDTHVGWGVFTARVQQQSDFRWQNGTVLPGSFRATQKVAFFSRRESVNFDWVSMRATGTKKRDDFELEITPGMQDKLTVYLLLARALCEDEVPVAAYVVSGPELKFYSYQLQAIEPLQTELGYLQAAHLRSGTAADAKQTDLWLSKATRFLPVRIVYRKNDEITDMRLLDISFSDEP